MVAILQTAFLNENVCIVMKISLIFVLKGAIKWVSVGSDNGLAPNSLAPVRCQAITWSNVDQDAMWGNRPHELTDIISHFYFQKHRCDFLWHCKSGVTCVKVNVSVKNSVNALDEAGCRFMCQRVVWGGVAYVSGNCSYGCYGWVCLETVTDCWRLLCGGSSVNRASESKKNLSGGKMRKANEVLFFFCLCITMYVDEKSSVLMLQTIGCDA